MGRTLVIPLSGQGASVMEAIRELVAADADVHSMAELARTRWSTLRGQRYECLAVVGAPPADEIGYGFSALIALAGRPRYVALVDLRCGQIVRKPLLRFLRQAALPTLGQLTASAAALAGQRILVTTTKRVAAPLSGAPTLSQLVYLRPTIGSPSPVGGSVTHAHGVIRALRARGVDVQAFTSDGAITQTAAADPDPPCSWRLVRTPNVAKALPASAAAGVDAMLVRAALPAARKADAIYQRHGRFSLAGAVIARLTGKPLFLEYNGPEAFKGRYWNPTPLHGQLAACEEASLTSASRIFVVSKVDRNSLLERGIEREKIVLNPNGVDVERFAAGNGATLRRRLGLEGRLVIGFVGTFGPWHGAPVLARAFRSIADQLPEASLLLVGDGPQLEATVGILEAGSAGERVVATGSVPPGEVPDYLAACDILVSPHVPLPAGVEFFGSPTKLFEYMAAGKAIVASRLGQIGDVLEHGRTGWLVTPGDAEALSSAILELAAVPEVRRELGSRARRLASERHSWNLNAQQVIRAYSTLIEPEVC